MASSESRGVNPVYRYRFAGVEYNEADGSLCVDGAAMALELRPLRVLAELLQQPGVVLTKTDLLANLWHGRDETSLSDNALANAVSKLREALGAAGAHVKTVRGVGYRLDASVERTVLGRPAESPLALAAGMPVPHRESYLLDRPLGRSAHGAVWLARQPLSQAVGVFKFCTDADGLSALKREYTLHRLLRDSLGDDPGFTQVLDANFSAAPYWLECAYGGVDLQAWSREAPGFGGLDREQRLALFLGVARSVAAAHSVGVLHKDLKPSNVLVYADAAGRWATRLTDFGSGRVLDSDILGRLDITSMGLTVTEGLAEDSGSATLFYLAPEVLRGQPPTVRSDLYALGLMLFQLLAGDFRRPMTPGWEQEIDDPLLREDLLAATQAQPAARPDTVAQWVERLARLPERRAEHEAEAAALRTAAEQAARLQRMRARRPYLMAAFACLALGLLASLWFYGQTRQALARAEEAGARAQAINEFLNKDVLLSADVTLAGSSNKLTMAEVIDRASARASDRFRGQPQTEASVRLQLAQVYQRMGSPAAEERELARAQALLQPILPTDDDQLLALRLRSAVAAAGRSAFKEATSQLDEVERVMGAQRLAGQSELAFLAAEARFTLLSLQHRVEDALPHGERALALLTALAGQDLHALATLRRELADGYHRFGNHKRALEVLETALQPPYSAATIGEVQFQRLRLGRARIHLAMGQGDLAEPVLIQVRDTLDRALGPTNHTSAVASSELAAYYAETGRFQEARTEAERGARSARLTLGPEHQATRITAMNLAMLTLRAGNPAEALPQIDAGRPWFVEKLGSERAPPVQAIDFARAQAMTSLGRPAPALAILGTLDAATLTQSAPFTDWEHRLAGERGRALLALGRGAEGRALLSQAIAGMEQAGSPAWVVGPLRRSLERAGSAEPAKR